MALFQDDQLVTVTTPDGRTVQVPASVAASLSMPQAPAQHLTEYLPGAGSQTLPPPSLPTPPPPPPPPPPPKQFGPNGTPIEETAGPVPKANRNIDDAALGTGAGQVIGAATGAIDRGVGNIPDSGPGLVGHEDKNASRVDPSTGQGMPGASDNSGASNQTGSGGTTTDQLRQEGYAGGYNAQEKANQGLQDAAINTADSEARGQNALAGVMADRNKRIDTMMDARQKQAEADLQAQVKRSADYDAAIKKYADTKIDRKADHPVLAGIGVAMAALGMAMMGKGAEKNPALDALYTAIDRKVAGQMANLDKQGKVLGHQKDAIERMRQQAGDQLALKNLMISGETERAARYMEEIGARTNSDVIKAKAVENAASLRARAADYKMAAIDKQNDSDQKVADRQQRDTDSKRSAAVAYSGQAMQYKMHKETLEYDREKLDAEMAKAMMEADKAGKTGKAALFATAAKENSQRGVFDVNGQYMLQPDGKKKFDEAKKLEENAAQVEKKNPAAATAMRTKASEMRQEVLTDEDKGVWRVRSPDNAAKVSEGLAGAQNVVRLTDEIKQLSASHGKDWLNTDVGRAQIQAKVTELTMALKNTWQLGVLSKQDTALIEKGTGGDPTQMDVSQFAYDMTNGLVGKDPKSYEGRLDALTAGAKTVAINSARYNGYRGNVDTFFGETKAPQNTDSGNAYKTLYQGKTTSEKLEGATGDGVKGTFIRGAQKVFYGHTDQDAIESNAAPNNGALDKDQGVALDTLVAKAKKNDPEARKLLLQAAADQSRPDLAGTVAGRIRDDLPDLYKQTDAGKTESKVRIPNLMYGSIENMASAATIDQSAFNELSRVAAGGDPYAQKLLKGVVDYKARGGK